MSDLEQAKQEPGKAASVFWWRASFALAAAGFSLLLFLQPTPWRVWAAAGSDPLNLAQTVYVGTWWGGLGAIVLMIFLFAICPWWACAADPTGGKSAAPATPRWFWPLVAAAVLAAGATAAPALGHSLWDDEHETLVWYVLGRYVRQAPDGQLKLKEHNWRRTIFGYSTPNNHIFHNILARSSNALWRAVVRPEGLQFNEVALRFPAFLAGLAGIAALALLLKDFGFPAPGVLAAWFLALHPWFTQHMALARGYTLTMLLAVLIVIFWRRALVSGSWLWWILLAVAELLALWTYPAIFFLLAMLNIALLWLIARQSSDVAGPPRTMLARWFCVSTIAAAGFLPLIAPLVPQIGGYLDSLNKARMGLPWLGNFASFLAGGAAWDNGSRTDYHYHDLQLVAQACGPLMIPALFTLTALLSALGFARFIRRNRIAAAAAFCFVLGPAVHWFYTEIKGIILWEWYLIYALPFVCLFWGVGAWSLASVAEKITHRRWASPAAAVIVLLFYVWATSPVTAWTLTHSKVPYRESTQASRSGPEANRTIVFSTTGAPLGYDPQLFYVEEPVDLAILMFQADAQKRALVANMGQMPTLQTAYPKVFAMLENRQLFPEVERFQGFFSGGDRFVCRYAPGSAASFDFAGLLTTEELSYARSKASVAPEVYFAGRTKRHAAQDAGGYGPSPGVGQEPHGFKK